MKMRHWLVAALFVGAAVLVGCSSSPTTPAPETPAETKPQTPVGGVEKGENLEAPPAPGAKK